MLSMICVLYSLKLALHRWRFECVCPRVIATQVASIDSDAHFESAHIQRSLYNLE